MNESLPRPTIDETLEAFILRAMEDHNMIREFRLDARRLEVTLARFSETQLSRNFYVAEVETPTESTVADPQHSRGKTLPERGEPLTDPETQRT